MLYEISIFWDGRFPGVTATARSIDEAHWVKIEAPDAASTTIHVATKDEANELAALINRLVTAKKLANAA